MLFIWLAAAQLALGSIPSAAPTRAATPAYRPPAQASGPGGVRPTLAWVRFCERLPAECAIDTTEAPIISFGPAAWDLIVSINAAVNNTIRPITDQDHWGVEDRWDYPDDGYGDCEDYQLLKRRLLVEAGLPRRALRMTVVLDEAGAGHAVLTAHTDQGDFILDNRRSAVLLRSATGYSYIKQEGSDDLAWISLDGRASPLSTANQ